MASATAAPRTRRLRVDLGPAAAMLGAAASWRRNATKYARAMHQVSQQAARSATQHDEREEVLEEKIADVASRPSAFTREGVVEVAKRSEAMLAFTVAGEGSVGRVVRDAVGNGATAMRHLHGERLKQVEDSPTPTRPTRPTSEDVFTMPDGIKRNLPTYEEIVRNASIARARRRMLVDALSRASVLGDAARHALPKMRRSHRRMHDTLVRDIPWASLLPNLETLVRADKASMEWWSRGAEGEPPAEAHSTFHSIFGHRVPPTEFGRLLRRMGHAVLHGELYPWEADGSLRRVAQENHHERHEFVDDEEEDENLDADENAYDFGGGSSARSPWSSTHTLLDGRKRSGGVRRLTEQFGEGLFGHILTVPSSNSSPHTPAIIAQKGAADWFEAIVSYAVYNVFLVRPPLVGDW